MGASLNVVLNCSCTMACWFCSFSFCLAASAQILPIFLVISSSSLVFCSCYSWSSSPLESGLCLSNHLQLPQSCAEVDCSVGLEALILFSAGSAAGAQSSTMEDKWWFSSELSHSASLVIRVRLISLFLLRQDDLSGRIQEQPAQMQL